MGTSMETIIKIFAFFACNGEMGSCGPFFSTEDFITSQRSTQGIALDLQKLLK